VIISVLDSKANSIISEVVERDRDIVIVRHVVMYELLYFAEDFELKVISTFALSCYLACVLEHTAYVSYNAHTVTHTHTHTVLTAIFPREPGLAGCPLNSSSPFIPGLRILFGTGLNFPCHS